MALSKNVPRLASTEYIPRLPPASRYRLKLTARRSRFALQTSRYTVRSVPN